MKTERLLAAVEAPALEAAWRYIQADLRVAMARRDRLREGRMKLREWLRGPDLRAQLEQCDAEASRLGSMLGAIDAVRSEVRKLESNSAL